MLVSSALENGFVGLARFGAQQNERGRQHDFSTRCDLSEETD
jgi:hypothetical protein